MSNLTGIAKALLMIDEDMPYRITHDEQRITVNDFDMYTFEQVWGSTAGGFDNRIGGSAMTSQRTFVFVPNSVKDGCIVYFGGSFAYKVPYSSVFMADVAKGNVASVSQKGRYVKAAEEEQAAAQAAETAKKADKTQEYIDKLRVTNAPAKLKDFADLFLNGKEYPLDIPEETERLAKEKGIVIIFGYSDDLVELRGAVDDEVGAFDGGTVYIKDGEVLEEEPADMEGVCRIKALWCPDGNDGFSWRYQTDLPHADFVVLEEGEPYCLGIVVDVTDMRKGE